MPNGRKNLLPILVSQFPEGELWDAIGRLDKLRIAHGFECVLVARIGDGIVGQWLILEGNRHILRIEPAVC